MKNRVLRICIWVLGVIAFLGNLSVIVWRKKDKEQNRLQSMMVLSLAFADMCMGIYLLIIASMDARWAGEYFKHDIEWRTGIGCKIAGILSMLSSEVSVMMLSFITAVRYMSVVYTFKVKQMLKRPQILTWCAMIWIVGLLISVLPVLGINYFTDEESGFGFYSRSAVCLPLHLSNTKPVGWEYSVAFFIGLNFLSFMFIIMAYSRIYYKMKTASKAARSKSKKRENELAVRLLLIITTDLLCWMPIIVIGFLSLIGQFPDPEKHAYVWIAVFVLPLNSSLNPILYTFSASTVKDTISGKSRRSKSRAFSSVAVQNMRINAIKISRSNLACEGSSTVITDTGMETRL